MSLFISSAVAQSAGAQSQGSPLITLLLFGGMFLFMYLLIIRPQRKRQKEHQNLVTALAKGDEVLLTSGLLGKIVKVDENYIVLETGDSIELKFQKVAVHAVLPKGTIKSIDAA